VSAIYSHAGGNPFYLEQLRRAGDGAGLPRGVAQQAGAPDAGVPPAVAAAIAAELESLSPRSRAFLDAAAVAGEPFEPDLAAAIGELSEHEGLAALDALLAFDFVRPTDVPRRFAFRHPLVRRGVYESTPGGWRLAAHARAAEALAARGADAAERAHHLEQSASQGNEDAIAVLLEAGRGGCRARAGCRRGLVRGDPATAAECRCRAPGQRPGGACLRQAVAWRAGAMPHHAAGRLGAASARGRHGPRRADRGRSLNRDPELELPRPQGPRLV
jgi:hypothetical protein